MKFCDNIPNSQNPFPFNHRRHLMKITTAILALLCVAAIATANDAVTYYNRGMESFNKEDYNQAISDFTQAIRLNPNYPAIYFNRGIAYHSKKDYDNAIADYTEAIRLAPNIESGYYGRGGAYLLKGDYSKAIEDFQTALRIDPNPNRSLAKKIQNDLGVAYNNRGREFFQKKDYDKAISDLDQAIRLGMNNAGVYAARGMAYHNNGNYDKAIEDYKTALRIDPEIPVDEMLEKAEIAQYAMSVLSKGQPNKSGGNAQEKTAPPPASGGMLTDSRDGKKYKTVKIGSQTWMAENLNYAANGSKCYDNNSGNCAKYGRLYDWNTAKKACPSGWHLPSQSEWDMLSNAVGGANVAGKKLKAKSGWSNNGNGTDDYGFSALPGGSGSSGGSFIYVGYNGYWWSASELEVISYNAYYRGMHYHYDNAGGYNHGKDGLFSVRCLQD
jgi:uncharacterized protein (TIGR02145 family)